jgi:hypothetical protein
MHAQYLSSQIDISAGSLFRMAHEAMQRDPHECHTRRSRRAFIRLCYWHPRATRAMAGSRALGLLMICLLAGCGAPTDPPSAAPRPVFNTTAEGDGNALKISAGDPVVVEVRSQSGIGAGLVELVSGAPPANIIVRLHLRGLEQFRYSAPAGLLRGTFATRASARATVVLRASLDRFLPRIGADARRSRGIVSLLYRGGLSAAGENPPR